MNIIKTAYNDGVRPITEIRDKNNNVVGWLFYFARDLNIVKNDKYRANKESIKVSIDKNGSMYPQLWGRDISSITKTENQVV